MNRPDLDEMTRWAETDFYGANTEDQLELIAYTRHLEQKLAAHHEIGALFRAYGDGAKVKLNFCPICEEFEEENQ